MSRVLITALFSLTMFAACGKKGGASEAIEKQKAYAENVCKCKDADCVTKAGQAYAKEMEEWAKKNAGKSADPGSISESDKKAMEEATKKITECTQKAMQAKADEPKKDEPKKDEPKKDEPKKDEPKKDEPKKDEPKAAEDTAQQKKAMEAWVKVGDAIAANEKDCKKMGEELKKLVTEYKDTIEAEKKDQAALNAWMEKHKDDMEAWNKKTEAGMKACEKDAVVAAQMKVLR